MWSLEVAGGHTDYSIRLSPNTVFYIETKELNVNNISPVKTSSPGESHRALHSGRGDTPGGLPSTPTSMDGSDDDSWGCEAKGVNFLSRVQQV